MSKKNRDAPIGTFSMGKTITFFEWSPPTDILSGIYSDIFFFDILSGMLFAILFWHFSWHFIWHIFWHFLCDILSGILFAILFWHFSWHSIWHIFWHICWHLFWHFIFRSRHSPQHLQLPIWRIWRPSPGRWPIKHEFGWICWISKLVLRHIHIWVWFHTYSYNSFDAW